MRDAVAGILKVSFFAALCLTGVNLLAQTEDSRAMNDKKIYTFNVKTIDGQDKPLSDYKGKTLLIVNTASKCGFTKQYKPLETLYEAYRDRGFEVLAFPANNFMGQEPGTNEEIKKFCEFKFNVQFPLFAKISVKGEDIHPLYRYLTEESGFNGGITWNFNKFLVSPKGDVVARFDSKTDPLAEEVVAKIESVLPLVKAQQEAHPVGQ